MFVEFKHSLRGFTGQILGWGISLALLGLLIVPIFDTFAGQQDSLDQLLSLYPEEMSAFLGDLSAMASPEGWLALEFFSYMPLILGIFAVQMGSGLLPVMKNRGSWIW